MLAGLLFLFPLAILAAGASANSPLRREDAGRFARRQLTDITAANGTGILRYLQVTRRWRWMGAAGGLALTPLLVAEMSFGVSPYLPLAGWLAGVAGGEIAFGRFRAPSRAPFLALFRVPSPRLSAPLSGAGRGDGGWACGWFRPCSPRPGRAARLSPAERH
ncbi:hypothetical protein [Nonomuraea sp. NPDC050783]|uniref:hypothetical protein n=1 Tax=Nonomuraea sp. NPDC050783 TaxID=3154634 RepID=UPI003467415C